MKVIEPLFLDELKEEFENSKGNKKKLNELLQRIWKIKIFDPACGSGNFLIIAYKELRKLEMLIFKEIDLLKGRLGSTKIDFENITLSEINLSNFFGIELDDFAHEVATLSLWLAEHQMNQAFKKEFGRSKPSLPLQETGNILHGNACRVDWDEVCPKNEKDEIYILGNPPYLGYALQSPEQREDMSIVFNNFDDYKKLDFIACWFYLGSKFIKNNNSKFAFVTTNSICQGE
jgi:type I restriction-modification system DNA methylase subunit